MCLIAFSIGQHPDYPLVVAANRDEFFRRPTAPMAWWPDADQPPVLAGRDLLSGGTWLAINVEGEVAAVTNIREGTAEAGRISRGELPLRALAQTGPDLQHDLVKQQNEYSGFNLIHLTSQSGWYFSNRDAHPGRTLHRGTYGLSNHLLQSPWPKLLRLRTAMAATLAATPVGAADRLHQALIPLLQDTSPAPDRDLPDTGVGLETERFLSSPFIVGADYGTRATTIVSVSRAGEVRVTEQTWGPMGKAGEQQRFCWQR
ncbi:NRDE family protein [Marinobacter sp.]|uniref:NRDE family protein n=1 Tax=Marinobacter sp. TaxID=50741 RepID=UPI0034A2B958